MSSSLVKAEKTYCEELITQKNIHMASKNFY